MTVDSLDEGGLPTQLPSALGSAVVTLGPDDTGVPALALWQVSPEGGATGAWILPQDEAFGDEAVARRLLTCIDGRAVTGQSRETVRTALGRLTHVANLRIVDDWWSARIFSLAGVFNDIVERREKYAKSIESKRQVNKNIVPLEWQRDFTSECRPVSVEELRALSRLGVAIGAPVASEALTVSRLLRWLVELWSETEQTKNRRRYLRDEHGELEGLPPTWLIPMEAAQSARLPL